MHACIAHAQPLPPCSCTPPPLLATLATLHAYAQAQQLRGAQQEPYAYRFDRTHHAAQLQQQYSDLGNGEADDSASVAIAGRIVGRRVMGKLAFLSLRDGSGQVRPEQRGTSRIAAASSCVSWRQGVPTLRVSALACTGSARIASTSQRRDGKHAPARSRRARAHPVAPAGASVR